MEFELLLVLRLYCAVFLSIVTCEAGRCSAAAGWTSVWLLTETPHPVTILPTFYRVTFHCTAQLTNSFFLHFCSLSHYMCVLPTSKFADIMRTSLYHISMTKFKIEVFAAGNPDSILMTILQENILILF